MEYLKISARYHRKLNLGDYESVEAELMIIAGLDTVDGATEDVESAAQLIHQQCKAAVWAALNEDMSQSLNQRHKVKVTRKFQGKVIGEKDYFPEIEQEEPF